MYLFLKMYGFMISSLFSTGMLLQKRYSLTKPSIHVNINVFQRETSCPVAKVKVMITIGTSIFKQLLDINKMANKMTAPDYRVNFCRAFVFWLFHLTRLRVTLWNGSKSNNWYREMTMVLIIMWQVEKDIIIKCI